MKLGKEYDVKTVYHYTWIGTIKVFVIILEAKKQKLELHQTQDFKSVKINSYELEEVSLEM